MRAATVPAATAGTQTSNNSKPPISSSFPFPWDADWADVAAFIDRASYPFPSTYVVAYSWGVGHGFLQLGGALERRGLSGAHATLCDGVHKPALRVTSWVALTSWPKLKVPANVRSVSWTGSV